MADLSTVASVTVTYHPDIALLRSQLAALPAELRKVLVDNGSPEATWRELATLTDHVQNLEVLRLEQNIGLAAGTNEGIQHIARTGGARFLLLLDQDSIPMPGAVERMVDAFFAMRDSGIPVGAVGPELLDPATGGHHGFHEIDGIWWRRIHPSGGAPVRCDGLNGSGTLVDSAVVEQIGGLDAGLFIDHVDTEWSFRLTSSGWLMFGIPGAEFEHRMGDQSMRLWLAGWTVWPIRSPLRHRYLFRNATRLWFRSYVPCVWKFWVIHKLIATSLVYAILGPSRWSQLKAMALGVVDGLRGRSGAI